jgi:hypothetical protein
VQRSRDIYQRYNLGEPEDFDVREEDLNSLMEAINVRSGIASTIARDARDYERDGERGTFERGIYAVPLWTDSPDCARWSWSASWPSALAAGAAARWRSRPRCPAPPRTPETLT